MKALRAMSRALLEPSPRSRLSPIVFAAAAVVMYIAASGFAARLLGDAVAGAGVGALVALGFALLMRRRTEGSFRAAPLEGAARSPRFWLVAAGALVACWLLGQLAAVFVLQTIGSDGFAQHQGARAASPVWLLLLVSIFLGPLGEESLVRGIVYPTMRLRWGIVVSALASSLVFALLHGNLVQLVLTLPLGVLLAIVYEATRLLWPVVAMHAAFNAAAVLIAPAALVPLAQPFVIAVMAVVAVIGVAVLGVWTKRLDEQRTSALLG